MSGDERGEFIVIPESLILRPSFYLVQWLEEINKRLERRLEELRRRREQLEELKSNTQRMQQSPEELQRRTPELRQPTKDLLRKASQLKELTRAHAQGHQPEEQRVTADERDEE